MGLVRAAIGAIGGTFADQWKDFLTVPAGIPSTAAFFPAVPSGANANRGSNTNGSQAGSRKSRVSAGQQACEGPVWIAGVVS